MAHFQSRKLLLHELNHRSMITTIRTNVEAVSSPPAPSPYTVNKGFDANVVMVLSVLLCALVFSLGLNFVMRCVLRCSRFVHIEPITSPESASIRLANTGIKKKALKTFTTICYWDGLKLPGLNKECVICLSDFISEEYIKILPKCNHGFHIKCIDKWLSSHSSCPTCRYSLIETCEKILSSGSCNNTTSSQVQGQNPSIMPLQPERFVQNYR
ncbi:RING-H2 finger protein ATL78-like [Rutidosis leptorrhynchoides]|uniref:RING-H2 finger protein ATL78-like n=1 Tax=Rutidosis leptorrhynchoides TaxID=125765 RepID=UPI003A996FAD